ncbi:RNA-binding protein 25 isoform X2 [Drosophila eugracilis]|uniref:RNA-binding protein 25 isoform X2 n=1 Tax=Drosophila eugracilis TaxID=29029 RepID=UPI001BDA0DA5|nr:RNA-binding protein 25 isoform X2 [Drosophila eugracilis]
MDRHRRERSPHRERRRERSPYRARRREHSPYREKRRERQQVLTYKQLQKMPLNLRKKAVREARNRNEKIRGNRKKWKKARQDVPTPTRRLQNNFDRSEHNAMLASTSQELRQILQDFETLSDIPHDITPIELRGELHQREPTIAQLKRAIALISRAQHKRNQRERNEERLRRRGIADDSNDRRQRQPVVVASSTGELVHSAQRNGHDHRAFVSWRFLWRCFGLLNVDTNQPIDDRSSSGRATLKELGIKNAATLKFVHRVKYFGRQRQS